MFVEGEAHFGACENSFGLTKIVPGVKYRFIFLLYDSWELLKNSCVFHQKLILNEQEKCSVAPRTRRMGSTGRFKNTRKTCIKTTYSQKRGQNDVKFVGGENR